MNKSRSARSPLVCSAVRAWESCVGAASGQTRLTSRHLEGCTDCREFFAEDTGFEQLLRRDAERLRSGSPDAGLERRILRAVREAGAEPGRGARGELSSVWGRALLASAVAALAIGLWGLRPEIVAQKSPVIAATRGESASSSSPGAAPTPPGGDWLRMLDIRRPNLVWAEKNPLEREIDSVRTDARAVIGFLALNFLPSKPVSPPSQG